jgi:hypothetical protein
MEKFVLVHHHIFKNAGSTIDWILDKHFGPQFAKLEANSATGVVTREALLKFLAKRKYIRAISSHHFHGHEFKSDAHIFFDILFLRHPLDRLRSMYDFYHSNKSINDAVATVAQKMRLGKFLEHLIQRQPHQVNDVQVNILANHGRYCRPPDRCDLSAARARLRSASMPGTLELFDESLTAAEFFLSPAFGELDLSYRKQNANPGRSASIEDRLKEIREECGARIYEQLLVMNQLDLKLLDYMNREVSRRVKLIPGFDEKLAGFRGRCARLAG